MIRIGGIHQEERYRATRRQRITRALVMYERCVEAARHEDAFKVEPVFDPEELSRGVFKVNVTFNPERWPFLRIEKAEEP